MANEDVLRVADRLLVAQELAKQALDSLHAASDVDQPHGDLTHDLREARMHARATLGLIQTALNRIAALDGDL